MVRGALADLDELLRRKGYSYQYRAGQPSHSVLGRAIYKDSHGDVKMLKRVAKGKPAVWTGATVGLIKTAQQPDVWAVFRRKKRQ